MDFEKMFQEGGISLSSTDSDVLFLSAMLHHCWKEHALKIDFPVTLLKISDALVLDVRDIHTITKDGQGYLVQRRQMSPLWILVDTPEYQAFERFYQQIPAIGPEDNDGSDKA